MESETTGGYINFSQCFERMQQQMLAQLAAGAVIEHSATFGAATELHWIQLLNQYLPSRYRASGAFVIDADGRRSRQIDIAIYDNFYSPLLFPHPSGPHLPAESVYAVFEVKQVVSADTIRDAACKAASVRALRRTSVPFPYAGGRYPAKEPPPILAGLLALSSGWLENLRGNLMDRLRLHPPEKQLDLGCALLQGAFETTFTPRGFHLDLSTPQESLVFFILRLLERLRALGTVPAVDLMQYGRRLESFARPITGD